MVFDSQRVKPSSEIVGTRPVGLLARYPSSSVPPNSPPASCRWYGISSSSQHQSTFCTLKEFFLPQTSSTTYPLLCGVCRKAITPHLQSEEFTGDRGKFFCMSACQHFSHRTADMPTARCAKGRSLCAPL